MKWNHPSNVMPVIGLDPGIATGIHVFLAAPRQPRLGWPPDQVRRRHARLRRSGSIRTGARFTSLCGIASALAAILSVLSALAVTPATARETVAATGYAPGTIVIHTNERRLYYYLTDGKALRYPVGVGRAGKQWSGTAFVNGKYLNPAWAPPQDIRRDKPDLPAVIAGGSPHNPMGVAALTLSGGEYAIHGTNRPESIGGFVSYGCIRMYNEDITDLYGRVDYNTPVVVTN